MRRWWRTKTATAGSRRQMVDPHFSREEEEEGKMSREGLYTQTVKEELKTDISCQGQELEGREEFKE